MLNFKNTSLLFFLAVLLCGASYFFFDVSLWWILLPVLLFKAAVIYGSATIQSNFHIEAHCHGNTDKKEIAITFDDGPNAEFTPQVLKVLKEYNAPATFFVIGKNIAGNEALLQQIDAAGHLIGNHTFSHAFFIDFKNKKGFIDELNQTLAAIYKATGRQIRLFRPPYGVTTPNLARAAKELDYSVVGWNVRSLDTKADSEKEILNRVTGQIKPGAVILFHDTSAKTVHVLKQTLNFAKENGFKIVSAEQLLGVKGYEI